MDAPNSYPYEANIQFYTEGGKNSEKKACRQTQTVATAVAVYVVLRPYLDRNT